MEPEAQVELTVLMPCLNEADTIETCVRKAMKAIREMNLSGEVVVADNGSTDGSDTLALEAGARVVRVEGKGYGAALMGGIEASRGRWIVMGDADDSYDFSELPGFVAKLREGWDVVQGCRLPWGGGTVRPGAMPMLHRWWGNPMFTLMARWMFGAPVHDVYCGMRGFDAVWQRSLSQRCTGMEFATEMLIKAALSGARITEVPITLHPDGRKAHAPHLRTFRDGWRTLRFFVMSSPRWLFVLPGLVMIAMGILGYGMAWAGLRIAGVEFGLHTLLASSLLMVVGWTGMMMGVVAKSFAVRERLLPDTANLVRVRRLFSLERALIFAALAVASGGVMTGSVAWKWWQTGFGTLDYLNTMRWFIPGSASITIGILTGFVAFVVSMIEIPRK